MPKGTDGSFLPEARRRIVHETCAGGVVFKDTPKGFRIGFIRNEQRKWTFAKGHVKDGEPIAAAALREVGEEMGMRELEIVSELGSIVISFHDRRGADPQVLIRKRIHFFLMQAPANAVFSPQKEEGISSVTWVGLTQVRTMSSYKNLDPIVGRAFDAIMLIKKSRERDEHS